MCSCTLCRPPLVPSQVFLRESLEHRLEKQREVEVLKAAMKKPGRDCLKCDTLAELQERLGCIDGSETTMDALKSSSKGPSVNNVTTKSKPKKETAKQAASRVKR